ncbi:MAG: hypothetical protein JXB85_10500 [Anaerolineales bacterium]|nr:hypothetical protein [Anaerolineales bacterium]
MNLKRRIKQLLGRLTGDPIKEMIKGGLQVGRNFNPQNEVIIDPSHYWHITIGDDVALAPRVYILAHDGTTKATLGYTRIGKVTIGDRVVIGAASIVMPGVTIGDDVIIGAGSVVTSDIPSNSVAVGNPARVIMTLDKYMEKRRQEMDRSPRFGEEYTLRANVSLAMKKEMNEKMKDRIGYIF